LVSIIVLVFIIIELIGAYLSNSVAIYSDVIHLFSDLSGFACSLIAIQLSKRNPSNYNTFGYARAEVMGAFFSLLIMYLMTIYIGIESI
jgi:cation diffusion facilitator family transporter